MQIRWSPGSAQDLEQIFNYIRTDNPDAAQRVAQTIYDRVLSRNGRARSRSVYRAAWPGGGDARVPLPPLPFIIVYRILEQADAIEIVNVIHGAQRWPPAT